MTTNNKNIDKQGKKLLNVPNLRFPEFEGEWEKAKLSDITQRVSRKNKSIVSDRPLTISAQFGLIDQRDFFNKVVASENLEGYYLLKKGEFAYNKSYSNEHPWGVVKRLDLYEEGALSTLYICFECKKANSDWLVHYFDSPKWNKQISEIAVEGARNHGLLNVSIEDFFKTYHFIPKIGKEQEKLANFLTLIDKRIATQSRIIEKYESLIYGLLDSIVAYPKDNKKYKLGELCEIRSGYSGTQNQMCKGLRVSRIETISNHHINLDKVGYVEPFEKSKTYKLNIGDILFTAYIDKDYALYHGMNLLRLIPNKTLVNPFYIYCLLNTQRAKNHFKSVCNKAVSQASINQTELSKTPIFIPTISKQENIARLFDILLRKREIERNNLTLFQKQKAYLLKEMFV